MNHGELVVLTAGGMSAMMLIHIVICWLSPAHFCILTIGAVPIASNLSQAEEGGGCHQDKAKSQRAEIDHIVFTLCVECEFIVSRLIL